MVDQDERKLLFAFFEWLQERDELNFFLITKNGRQFDIPFILTRLFVKDLYAEIPEELDTDIRQYDHFDLQEITSKRISLQTLAELLNCAPKSGTGQNAIKLWNERRYDELRDYCAQDVDTTEEVFLKWRKLQEAER